MLLQTGAFQKARRPRGKLEGNSHFFNKIKVLLSCSEKRKLGKTISGPGEDEKPIRKLDV